jgi:hypothetical protein
MIAIYKFFNKMSENTVRFPSQIIEKSSDNKPVVPEQRIKAVVEREDRKIDEAKNSILDNRDAVLEMEEGNKEITSQKNEQEANYRQEKKHTNLSEIQRQTKENQFFGLGKLFGKKEREVQRAEDEQKMAEIRSKLEQVTEADKQNQQDLQETNEAISQNEKKAKHAEELVRANKLGGPMRTSEGMREALQKQDSVKFYREVNYPIENTDYLIPQPIIEQLTPKIQTLVLNAGTYDSDSSVHFDLIRVQKIEEKVTKNKKILEEGSVNQVITQELSEDQKSLELEKTKLQLKVNSEVRKAIIGITPFYEKIIKLTDQEQIPLSQHLLTQMITRGMQISSVEGWEFAEKVLGRRVDRGMAFMSRGDSELEKFFSRYKNIQGRNRLPYVLAFGAGALIDNHYYKQDSVHQSLRNLLAETLPVPRTESVIENNQWVTKTTEPQEKGYGHVLKLSERRGYGKTLKDLIETTDDPGWYEAVKEANQIVSNIYKVMLEKGPYVVDKVGDKYSRPLQEMTKKFVGNSGLYVDPKNLFSEPILNQSRY